MSRLLRCIEIAGWSICLLCAAGLVVSRVQAAGAQRTAAAIKAGVTGRAAPGAPHASDPDDATPFSVGPVLGRLEIPALGLHTPIVDDADPHSLRLGAGHIPGTAMPGGLGNFALAAHRDTYFRPLRNIRKGMQIRVITPDDTFVYVVDSTSVIAPEDVKVLDTGNVPEMTLITCYPFNYVGAAPRRFAVRAHLLSY